MHRTLLTLCLWFLFSTVEANTHCTSKEVVYFSCEIRDSQKVVSLCGETEVDSENPNVPKVSWLQYRFGRIGHPEMLFPKQRTGSIERFTGYWSFSRLNQFSLEYVSFYNNGLTYSVSRTESAPQNPDELNNFAGVVVRKGLKEIAALPCSDFGKVENGLRDAIRAVPKDE